MFSIRLLFIHYDPLGSSSYGFAGDYPRSAAALKNFPIPQLIPVFMYNTNSIPY
ncbi:hypothetical protein D1BOALGB6SA_5179 [Olavius sp. associated proteobacterium Delta 1]|nr:hypothetical protein D1BOALGB6SA_5179 [Olavius sp. associated proteobacterium Delta 1]